MEEKSYYSISEIAKVLGISRVAIFKKIKSGKIKAIKIGRMYAIPALEFESLTGKKLTDNQKRVIEKAVVKTVREYGEVLKLLGRE